MEVSYKRDVNHSFLVIRPENEVDTKAYPVRMVLGNVIPGLLPCRLQKADGTILLYYDITARQQLSEMYQKLGFTELKNIYQEFLRIFGQLKMYLLNMDQLLLEPEYVYLDKKEEIMYLCYLPGYEKPVQEQLKDFTEYLLPRMEHQDSKGVMLGYSIYRLLAEEGFQMEAVREILHKTENQKAQLASAAEKEEEKIEAEVPEGRNFTDSQGRTEEKEEQKKVRGKDAALLLMGFGILAGSVACRQMGYFGEMWLPVMLGVLFAAILGISFVLWIDNWKKTKKKKKDTWESEEDHKLWEDMEPSDTLYQENMENTEGEETVVLYRGEEYGCCVLVCEETGQAPQIILNREMMVIGKMEGVSDVLLDRPSISRIHAKIQKKEDSYFIADLNSKNGTFINGRKLEQEEEYLLQPEDQVVFADVRYRFIKNG